LWVPGYAVRKASLELAKYRSIIRDSIIAHEFSHVLSSMSRHRAKRQFEIVRILE